MINLGLIGCGTVGSGVIKLLNENKDIITKRVGQPLFLKKVIDKDRVKCLALGITEEQMAASVDEIINDSEIDIIIELIGGTETAYQIITAAMRAGKNIVTANKDLIALRGKELFDLAESNKVDIYFEASVAGGIPVVFPLKQSLSANNIKEVIGILNGTTNYILTKMSSEGLPLDQVLKEAQELGYAEANPESDVEGLDAARKIAILSAIAFNSRVSLNQVYVEGIMSIATEDINNAKALGYVIKLLAIAKENENREIEVRVHPAFIPYDHPLASVHNVNNAIYIKGDAVGEVMLYGHGAGQMPTASAVLGDVIEISRNILHNAINRIGCTCFDEKTVIDISQLKSEYYIRMTVLDRPGVLAGIAGVFGNNRVSIATVLQQVSRGSLAELILITHTVKESDLRDSLLILKDMSIVSEINNVIRVENSK